MSEVVVIAFEVVEIKHHDGEGTVFAASGAEFALEELLHVAAVVKAGEWVADGLRAGGFPGVKVSNCDPDLFGDRGGHLAAASKGVGAIVWVRRGKYGIVILDSQRSEGVAVGDERNADRRALPRAGESNAVRSVHRDARGCARGEAPNIVRGERSGQWDRPPIARRIPRGSWKR